MAWKTIIFPHKKHLWRRSSRWPASSGTRTTATSAPWASAPTTSCGRAPASFAAGRRTKMDGRRGWEKAMVKWKTDVDLVGGKWNLELIFPYLGNVIIPWKWKILEIWERWVGQAANLMIFWPFFWGDLSLNELRHLKQTSCYLWQRCACCLFFVCSRRLCLLLVHSLNFIFKVVVQKTPE